MHRYSDSVLCACDADRGHHTGGGIVAQRTDDEDECRFLDYVWHRVDNIMYCLIPVYDVCGMADSQIGAQVCKDVLEGYCDIWIVRTQLVTDWIDFTS